MEPGEKLAAQLRKYPIWPVPSETAAPREWRDPNAPNFEPSIYQAPLQTFDPTAMVGEIRRPEHAARGLRQWMQGMYSRIAKIRATKETDELGQFLRNLLSGTWWHARQSAFPNEGEMTTLATMRRKGTLFGEPVGSSLTKHPTKIEGSFGPELIRVAPEWKGDPLDEVLFHQWKPHAEVMNRIYEDTIVELADRYPDLAHMEGYTGHKGLSYIVPVEVFNEAYTKNLEKAGYKGVLYSPEERYAEWELKMFPGKAAKGMASDWVWPLDMRTAGRPGRKAVKRWDRVFGYKLRKEWEKWAKQGEYHHLKEHFAEIDLKAVAKRIREGRPLVELEMPDEAIPKMTPEEFGKKWKETGKVPGLETPQDVLDFEMEVENAVWQHGKTIKDWIYSAKGDVPSAMEATQVLKEMTGLDQKTIYSKIMNNKGGELIEAALHKHVKVEAPKAMTMTKNNIKYYAKVLEAYAKQGKSPYAISDIMSKMKKATGLAEDEIMHLSKLQAYDTLYNFTDEGMKELFK